MQKIRFLKSIDGFSEGDEVSVQNTAAHRYIDGGFAALTSVYKNRMMTSEPSFSLFAKDPPAPEEDHG